MKSTRRMNASSLLGFLLLVGVGGCLKADSTLTYADLVSRMTDLDQLAVLPPAGEKTSLASSYDRQSRYDAATDQYINWDGNDDGNGYVRKEGDKTVMADITGPGCIWRIWSAKPGDAHVKIYLDGSETPAVDLPFKSYFDRSSEPFTRPNLVYTAAQGLNNYTPISFQKSCKIIADPNWGNFYHFNYTVFPAGTVVPTFATSLAPADAKALDDANAILGQSGTDPGKSRAGLKLETNAVTAAPGVNTLIANLQGPGAVTSIKVHVDLPKDPIAQETFLRQLTIRITWDDQTSPAVWSPIGDFFGTNGGSLPHPSFPTGLAADGTLYAYWYMPFGKTARIEMGNDSSAPVVANWEIGHAPLTRPLETLGYFHAKWHRNATEPMRPDRWPDWSLLTTQGRGRFVGTNLELLRIRGSWWGEGDEKFFIDGEKFPSTYGTGSEDYFGYAWGSPQLFCEPYHGQPYRAPWIPAQGTVYRYHVSDSVPFQTSFEGVLEKYLPENRTQYAVVVYWYLSPQGVDSYAEVPVGDRVDYLLHPEPFDVNLIEGEEMGFDMKWGHPRPMQDRNFSGAGGCWFHTDKVGDVSEIPFKMRKDGRYKVKVAFRREPEGGIYQLMIAGQKAGDPIDFYDAKMSYPDPVDLGTFDLKTGDVIFGMTSMGANPAAKPGMKMAVDYLKLEPAP